MRRKFIPSGVYYFLALIILSFHFGCVTMPKEYSEERIARDLQAIHDRLGYTGHDLWMEISNSADYTREQAIDLKHRVGELVVAYEDLFVEAGCREHNFPSCKDLFTAGLRFNISILDAEHKDLPPLPPIVKGYR